MYISEDAFARQCRHSREVILDDELRTRIREQYGSMESVFRLWN